MKLIALLSFILSTSVFAVEIKVTEQPVDFFRPQAQALFAMNMELGRAWVELKMYDPNSNGEVGNGSVYTSAQVPGLAFDKAASKITLTHEGQFFECANLVRRWNGTRLYMTGCELKTRKVTRTIDDGYRTYKRDFYEVVLKTK